MDKWYYQMAKPSVIALVACISVAALIGYIVNHPSIPLKDGSFVSSNGQYGEEKIDADAIYLYDRHKRLIVSDRSPICLAKFNLVKRWMTIEEVRQILGSPIGGDESREVWYGPDGAFVLMYFHNGEVNLKARNFDGEHESPDRWNRFWSNTHQVNGNFGAITGLLPS
ncbi:hypothetical protein CCAX7_17070 [Capsulimonas corticalis]|uniref:Uncharacterized protein n=1 Tax=Capsulimonas corticalis TaxID=2219043 RepID=A0A402D472_9BACT|nr:hypothetical protein [Capsulimonas corticalis]BDI29656.1 hypothetical protein CCAX7_17070 [Capsulimonas corticalis]